MQIERLQMLVYFPHIYLSHWIYTTIPRKIDSQMVHIGTITGLWLSKLFIVETEGTSKLNSVHN